jgi:hypothetical protein
VGDGAPAVPRLECNSASKLSVADELLPAIALMGIPQRVEATSIADCLRPIFAISSSIWFRPFLLMAA